MNRSGAPTARCSNGSRPVLAAGRAAAIARAVERWFPRAARDLPWRTSRRDPYHALVAETMLQQTQAGRVAERFPEFIRRFPTVHDLAGAEERAVLAAWSGLGYYRRALNLLGAARRIARDHGGRVPRSTRRLLELPGVGRYTAGAVASIVFGRREAIVDGNVRRVLLRVEGVAATMDSAASNRWAWGAAAALVGAARRPGVLNEGLMELGATVCTPGAPRCVECPLRRLCAAASAGPVARRARRSGAARPVLYCASVVVRDHGSGRLLVRRRSERGLWPGLWEAPSVERPDRPPSPAEARAATGIRLLSIIEDPAAAFTHLTTHRRIEFRVYRAAARASAATAGTDRLWIAPGRLRTLGLSTPQRRILLDGSPALPRAGPARPGGRAPAPRRGGSR